MSVGALSGVRVIDASRILAGPYSAQILGDLGAEIIKIESPAGDDTRRFGLEVQEGSAAYFLGLNRNKKSLILDLNDKAAFEVFWRLLSNADVLIENFKYSSWQSWGIDDPRSIGEHFPHLIHCRITGYGDDGPLGKAPGYDAAVQAVSGLMSVNGCADGGPLRIGVPIVDLTTGMQASVAVLAALNERHRSGKGQFCDVALFDCALAIGHPYLTEYLWTGKEPSRFGNGHPSVVPYDAYETKNCTVYLAAGNDGQVQTLWHVLGCPEYIKDPRFATNADRIKHRAALDILLKKLFSQADGYQLSQELQDAGVPCSVISSMPEAIAGEHAKHRNMLLKEDGYVGVGFAFKLSRTPLTLRNKPPKKGQHTREVLLKAGFKHEEIEQLEGMGTIKI